MTSLNWFDIYILTCYIPLCNINSISGRSNDIFLHRDQRAHEQTKISDQYRIQVLRNKTTKKTFASYLWQEPTCNINIMTCLTNS